MWRFTMARSRRILRLVCLPYFRRGRYRPRRLSGEDDLRVRAEFFDTVTCTPSGNIWPRPHRRHRDRPRRHAVAVRADAAGASSMIKPQASDRRARATPGVTLGIISGRPRELVVDLAQRFPSVAFAAEHGVWRCASGVWESALDPGAAARRDRARADRPREALSRCARRAQDVLGVSALATRREPYHDADRRRRRSDRRRVARDAAVARAPAGRRDARGSPSRRPQGHRRSRGCAATAPPARRCSRSATTSPTRTCSSACATPTSASSSRQQPRRTQAGLRLPSIAAVHRFLRWLDRCARQSRPSQAARGCSSSRARRSRRPPPQLIVA